MVVGALTPATPESASVALKLTVTSVLFQPAAFGGGLEAAFRSGGVLSRFTVTLVLAAFPARSVAVPVTTCLAPSPDTETGGGHAAIPLVASEQVKLTVASVLFQPCAS